ncbi:DUF3139 domain-containing protein [Savagea sp. SN6]|uniref:DUF3139 domain-containing protein n=2 Tax=Savagea serpentis TaxID=2785297 RepID=A0A8J7KM88_9BACL|nr:DUF3139 domain-containing protein [Savagea serpentis]
MIMMILFIFAISFFLIFYYPVQKKLAFKKFNEYLIKQDTNRDNIESLNAFKDYKMGGYQLIVKFYDDPHHMYIYHYYLWTHRKNESIQFDEMCLSIIDEENSVELDPPYNDNVKYKP